MIVQEIVTINNRVDSINIVISYLEHLTKYIIGEINITSDVINDMKKFSKFIIVGGQIGVSSESSSDFILSDISHEIDENIYNSIVIIIPYPQIDNNITTLLSVDLNVNTQKKQLQIINNEKDNRICTFYTIDNLKYTTCNILTLMNILKDFLSFSNGVSQSDSN